MIRFCKIRARNSQYFAIRDVMQQTRKVILIETGSLDAGKIT